MAANFKNASANIAITPTTVYTTPAATESVIHGFYISNDTGVDRTVTIEWYDSSAVATIVLAKDIPVYANDTFIFDGKLNLEASDYIRCTADAASALEATLAIMEKS